MLGVDEHRLNDEMDGGMAKGMTDSAECYCQNTRTHTAAMFNKP